MYITLSFQVVILSEKLISNMQLYVQLACAGLLKCYHNMSVFNWVKPTQAFSHFLTYPHSTHKTIHTNKTIHKPPITLWITTPTLLHPPTLLFCRTYHTYTHDTHTQALKQHTQQHNTHKQYNNTTTAQKNLLQPPLQPYNTNNI